MLKRIIQKSTLIIDYRMGILGALIMGIIVFAINYDKYYIAGAFTAGMKQALYTFLLGGFFIKLCERLATEIKDYSKAISAAIIIPSVLTLILTFLLHTLKGTPKPLQSCIPTLMIIPSTAVWAYQKRKAKGFKWEEQEQSPPKGKERVLMPQKFQSDGSS